MIRSACLAAIAITCFAATPDLNGVWRLDVNSSQFDRQPPPRLAADRIEHKDPGLVMHSTRAQGKGTESTGVVRYRVGGEGENVLMGNTLRYAARWDGPTLEIVMKGHIRDNAIVLTDQYALSGDG